MKAFPFKSVRCFLLLPEHKHRMLSCYLEIKMENITAVHPVEQPLDCELLLLI